MKIINLNHFIWYLNSSIIWGPRGDAGVTPLLNIIQINLLKKSNKGLFSLEDHHRDVAGVWVGVHSWDSSKLSSAFLSLSYQDDEEFGCQE